MSGVTTSVNSLRGPNGRLPGAHSDIGGGYPDNFHERIQVGLPRKFRGYHPRESYEYTRILMDRKRTAGEGWLGSYSPDAILTV